MNKYLKEIAEELEIPELYRYSDEGLMGAITMAIQRLKESKEQESKKDENMSKDIVDRMKESARKLSEIGLPSSGHDPSMTNAIIRLQDGAYEIEQLRKENEALRKRVENKKGNLRCARPDFSTPRSDICFNCGRHKDHPAHSYQGYDPVEESNQLRKELEEYKQRIKELESDKNGLADQLWENSKRLEELKHEKEQAIREANRRDQKWMEGIEAICQRKINFDPPSECPYPTLEEYINTLVRGQADAEHQVRSLKYELNQLKEKQIQDKLQTFVDELIANGIVSVETR